MGRVLDVAASFCNDISIAMGEKNVIFVWGRCLEQSIRVPTYKPLKHLHDAFAFYSSRPVTHQPLIVYGEPTEASLIDCLWQAFNDPVSIFQGSLHFLLCLLFYLIIFIFYERLQAT